MAYLLIMVSKTVQLLAFNYVHLTRENVTLFSGSGEFSGKRDLQGQIIQAFPSFPGLRAELSYANSLLGVALMSFYLVVESQKKHLMFSGAFKSLMQLQQSNLTSHRCHNVTTVLT